MCAATACTPGQSSAVSSSRCSTTGAVWMKWAHRDKEKVGPWVSLPAKPVMTMVVPAADTNPVMWRYTTVRPPADWTKPGFDASGVERGAVRLRQQRRTPYRLDDRRHLDPPSDHRADGPFLQSAVLCVSRRGYRDLHRRCGGRARGGIHHQLRAAGDVVGRPRPAETGRDRHHRRPLPPDRRRVRASTSASWT